MLKCVAIGDVIWRDLRAHEGRRLPSTMTGTAPRAAYLPLFGVQVAAAAARQVRREAASASRRDRTRSGGGCKALRLPPRQPRALQNRQGKSKGKWSIPVSN